MSRIKNFFHWLYELLNSCCDVVWIDHNPRYRFGIEDKKEKNICWKCHRRIEETLCLKEMGWL